MAKKYLVNDGKLLLQLEEAEEGGFLVTSPMDPELVTEAETVSEAFAMARDAMSALPSRALSFASSLPLPWQRVNCGPTKA